MDHHATGPRRPNGGYLKPARDQGRNPFDQAGVNVGRAANSASPRSRVRDQPSSTAGSTPRLTGKPNFGHPPPVPALAHYPADLPPGGRGPPPPRPHRPPFLPSPVQRHQQSDQRRYWNESNPSFPGPDSHPNSSQRSSSAYSNSSRSSVSSIPDFFLPSAPPLPYMSPLPPRRAANLGPPPSARKGGPAMYSASSFVPPIPEEASETHSSYASSHVMPTSWGDGPPEYYLGEGIDEEDESESGTSGRQSRAENPDESTGLVRQASIGKVGKPKLRSIKSGEGLEDNRRDSGSQELEKVAPLPTGLTGGTPRGPDVSETAVDNLVFYNPPTTGDALPTPSLTAPSSAPSSGNITPVAPLDPRINKILGSLEKGGAIGSGSSTSPNAPSPEPSEQAQSARRPPRLNLAATRDAEVRGSSSSLPELIRRATKLASNLDRGKTASRLGLLNILEAKEKERSPKGSREGSISDILAAFPSPSLATPTGARPGSRWPSPLPKSGLTKGQSRPGSPSFNEKHQTRRLCGMPLWAFVLLCIILMILVAAAVIVPVTLVVLPRQHDKSPNKRLEACKKSNPCVHDGTSVLVNNQCRCVCSGGFLGAACETVADNACTNSEITTPDQPTITFKGATMASGIPRLLQGAQPNFSLPLSAQNLLSMFAYHNLSCASENELITFNGETSQRRSLLLHIRNDFLPAPELALPHASIPSPRVLVYTSTSTTGTAQPTNHDRMQLAPRADSDSPVTGSVTSTQAPGPTGAALTSNGIIFAAPSGAAPPPASPSPAASSSPPSSTTSSSISGDNSSDPSNATPQILDFARIATLFVFQETSSYEAAISTQEKLRSALKGASIGTGNGADLSHCEVANGIIVNFRSFTVDMGNGTVFGGGPRGVL